MKSVFISHAYSESSKVKQLMEILQSEDVAVFRADEMVVGSEWQAEILSMIRKCSLFVALVDNPSPNVMLELGYALGAAKPVLLMASNEAQIPFDVAALPVVRFDAYEMGTVYDVAEKLLKRLSVENRVPPRLIGGSQSIRHLVENPDYLEEVSPQEFEGIVLEYFTELGFQATKSTPHSDGGYDIRLCDSATSQVVIVEVKKYARNSKLGVASVHQLLGSMVVTDATMAILVTTGGFSASALSMAQKAPRHIKLLTLDELANTSRNEIFAGTSKTNQLMN